MADHMSTLNSRASGFPRLSRLVLGCITFAQSPETLAEAHAVTAHVVTVCRDSRTNEYRIRESHRPATPDSKETCW